MKVETGSEQLFFTTVRISSECTDGVSHGTGFLFERLDPETGQAAIQVIVTNKHVVADGLVGKFWFTKMDGEGNPIVGEKWDISIGDFEQHWYGHPNAEVDVAVMFAGPLLHELRERAWPPYFKTISSDIIPSLGQWEDLEAIEDVTFIGYPNGMFDPVNLMPLARQGTTATPPELDYEGKPTFLIDASVFPGSSGSPVFIFNRGTWTSKNVTHVGNRLLFVGIVSSVFAADQHGVIEVVPIPTKIELRSKAKQMIDIGIAFKSTTIVETVDHAMGLKGISFPSEQSN